MGSFQSKPCLWLLAEMKADNELAISLPVYFKYEKMKICFQKKKQNEQKTVKKSFLWPESTNFGHRVI